MNELALFAGAGGGLLGSRLLGWRTVCAVELNPFCRSVIAQRQNDHALGCFPMWDDVRTFDGKPWRGIIDVVSGGFPCQRFSSAARGRNNADNLWPEMRRIVADVAPRHVLAENVTKCAIEAAASDLADFGYFVRIGRFTAKELGADHIRKRFWVRAYADDKSELHMQEHAKVAKLPCIFSSVWQANPRDSRISDGLANRMERIEATGNGQLPQMVVLAWEALKP